MIKVNGERFVVTGGAGFIGSHIAEELIRQGKNVIIVDNDFKFKFKFPHKEWRAVSQNINVAHARDSVFERWLGADTIFHQACSKCTVCRDDPKEDLLVNAWGAFRVFGIAQKIKAKVVHASTGSVYGDGDILETCGAYFGEPTTEITQYAPKSFYGVSKLAGEQYLRAFQEYYGLRFVALRYFHVFGPRQDSGPNGGVVAIFITKMLKGEPLIVYGDGKQIRSFTYVKDVVAANFYAANSTEMEGEYYNVASGISVSLNELIEALSGIIGSKPKVEYRSMRRGDIKYFDVSNDKIASAGYSEWSDFTGALRETVEWYRGNI